MTNNSDQKKQYILGVPLTDLRSYRHAEDTIVEHVHNGTKTFCIAINPEKIYRSQSDSELMGLINSADFHICDGVGAAIAANILIRQKIARITGVQLFYNLMARAEKEELKVFLLGAKPKSNEGAYQKLKEMHPQLKIVGRQDGYFKDDLKVVEQINDSGADMVFVALGSPRQEQWISNHRNIINAPYCMGIGGTLDVVSGNVKWAPMFFRKTGTEFLYRLVCEPTRFKRQLVIPKFMLLVLKAKFCKQN